MELSVKNTIVIIPSYNEESTIANIIQDIIKIGLFVLVIDDGSIDNTFKEAVASGAKVLKNKKNKGKGFSIIRSINYVLQETSYEWVVIMDGDGQHDVKDIYKFLNLMQQENVDIIIGNRMLNVKNMPIVRYFTNLLTSWIISILCKQSISDVQCGYRAINRKILEKMDLKCFNYDIESEMLIQAAQYDAKIKSVTIQTIYGDEVSKINPIVDTFRFIFLIFKYIFVIKKKNK